MQKFTYVSFNCTVVGLKLLYAPRSRSTSNWIPWFNSKRWDIRESAYSHPSISKKCIAANSACSMCLAAVRSCIRCRSCQNCWPFVSACIVVTRQDPPRRNSLNKREIASTSASKAAIGVYIYWMRTCNKRDIHSFLLKYRPFFGIRQFFIFTVGKRTRMFVL